MRYVAPRDMKTKHLFYAWLMIWNHTCPPELQYWFTHEYEFAPFYTPEYMLRAFRAFYIELKRRNDIGPKMAKAIKDIESHYMKWAASNTIALRLEREAQSKRIIHE